MFNSSSTNRDLPFPSSPPPPHQPFLGHDSHQDIFSYSQYYNNTDLLMNSFLSANFTNFDSISSPPPPPSIIFPNKTTTMSTTRTTTKVQENLGFPRKRKQGKTDRHSKICTAQGPRDRRVRLSIGIARKFFDLQDMLGFDKASKTIEWLLNKSKEAIEELSDEFCNFEDDEDEDDDEEEKLKKAADSSSCSTKESRAKARARARERTIEKLSSKDHSDLILKKPTNCDQNWEIPGSSLRSSFRDMTDMNLSPPGTHF